MNAKDLSPEVRDRLKRSLADHWRHFTQLRLWMEKEGWYTADAAYLGVVAAEASIHGVICVVADSGK